jgi:hypothetical protein
VPRESRLSARQSKIRFWLEYRNPGATYQLHSDITPGADEDLIYPSAAVPSLPAVAQADAQRVARDLTIAASSSMPECRFRSGSEASGRNPS